MLKCNDSSTHRAVHPQEYSMVGDENWHMPVWAPVPLWTFVESPSKLHWHGEVWPFSWFTNQAVSVFQILQTGCTDLVQEMMTVRRTTVSASMAGVSVRRDTTTPSAARPVRPVSWLPSLLLPLFVFPPCRSITYTSVTLVSVTTESTNKTLISARKMSHKQQQRLELSTVTLTWHASKHKVHTLHQRYILRMYFCWSLCCVGVTSSGR